jgi:hypothetical protein
MQTLDGYRSAHSQLPQMIEDLRALLTQEPLRIHPNAKTACELLCDLGERVRQHLTDEDWGLYPSLPIHEYPHMASLAWRMIGDERPLRKHCNFDFSDAFLAEFREVFDPIAQRIEREELTLLPKLLEIGLLHEARL